MKANWGKNTFWIFVIFYLILSLFLIGFKGIWLIAIILSLPILLYVYSEPLGSYMGQMGGAGLYPDYKTPGWLVRGFAWAILLIIVGVTIYFSFIKNLEF